MSSPTPSPEKPTASAAARVVAGMISSEPNAVHAITGSAGSGKSFLAREIAALIGCSVYSADFRFIGDSAARRDLLSRKQARSLSDFRDSANQFNWWDWNKIDGDLAELSIGRAVTIPSAYDRTSGSAGAAQVIAPSRPILLEGALLGPPQIVSRVKRIFFLCTPPRIRFERILAKDQGRRSFNEILARFLITEYSETLHYRALIASAQDRMLFIDSETGQPADRPDLPDQLFIPLQVAS